MRSVSTQVCKTAPLNLFSRRDHCNSSSTPCSGAGHCLATHKKIFYYWSGPPTAAKHPEVPAPFQEHHCLSQRIWASLVRAKPLFGWVLFSSWIKENLAQLCVSVWVSELAVFNSEWNRHGIYYLYWRVIYSLGHVLGAVGMENKNALFESFAK